MKKNEGEVPQYYVTGHHEPILETTVLNTESLQAQPTTLTKELEETIVLIDQLIETAKRMLGPTPVSTFRGPLSGNAERATDALRSETNPRARTLLAEAHARIRSFKLANQGF